MAKEDVAAKAEKTEAKGDAEHSATFHRDERYSASQEYVRKGSDIRYTAEQSATGKITLHPVSGGQATTVTDEEWETQFDVATEKTTALPDPIDATPAAADGTADKEVWWHDAGHAETKARQDAQVARDKAAGYGDPK